MKKIFARRSYFLSTFLLVVAFVSAASLTSYNVRAQTSSALTGYAWSDTVGWISFSGTSPSYGISEDISGNLTGYAWSDNIGWIKFGGLSGFPSGSGSSNENALVDSSGKLHGWARACAGTAAGDCSSMTSRTDGWDGWISLDGTNYGVNFASGNGQYTQSAYAWGSDVVGWISFNPSNLSSPANPSCNPALEACGGGPGGLTPAVNFSISSSSVATGTPATLTWNTSNVTTCSASSTGISTDSQWTNSSFTTGGANLATSSGSRSTSGFNTVGTETYSLTCVAVAQAGGGNITNSVTLTVNARSNTPSGTGMCTSVPVNSTLCSGSALPGSGSSVSSLVSSCTASGGSPLCQYTCSAGYHQAGNQCIGNSSLQEQ